MDEPAAAVGEPAAADVTQHGSGLPAELER